MTRKFVCFVPGKAVPQGSMRGFVIGGRAVLTSANKALAPWRQVMHTAFAEVSHACGTSEAGESYPLFFLGPVCVSCEIILPRLAKHPKTAAGAAVGYPVGRGDLDKHQRAIGDALTTSRVLCDDGQICQWNASKRYAEIGETPGVLVEVTEL